MKLVNRLKKTANQFWQQIDPFSLQVRLTIGIAFLSAVGLSSVAIWISWQMQQILISTHKQNIKYIADRFPRDVEIYSQLLPVEKGLQKAIDNLSTGNTLLWVRRPDGIILAQSEGLQDDSESPDAVLLSLSRMPLQPQVYDVEKRYWVLYGGELKVKRKTLGRLYIAKDITEDQNVFLTMVNNLAIVSLLSILTILLAIAIYIQRSLRPLRELSQLAGTISPDRLGKAQLQLWNAPTEVKELTQTWSLMLSRLSQAWEQERQFVSNVSHELRTPLTIVRGYLQSTLRRGINLTEPQQEALTIASSEADRTIRMLQDLLDLARADNGNLHFHWEQIILNDLVSEIGSMAEQFTNREIVVEDQAGKVEVKADRNRLKQVLLNLIDNAVKYSEPEQAITLKLQDDSEQAIVQVCDRGCGIPLQHQTRIFERFYRVDEARSRSTGGAGLGLSIVKTLVEGMGGSVAVGSKLDEGSIFTVTLPTQSAK